MKVALINHYPPQSGAGRYAYGLYLAMRKDKSINYDMICMNPMKEEDLQEEVNKDVVFLDKFSYSKHPNLSKVLLYFINPLRIPKSYDLYHMADQMLSRFSKYCRPSIISVHDIYPYKYPEKHLPLLYNIFAKKCVEFIKYADRIIASSKYTKDDIVKTFEIDPQKIEVIHFGLDHQLFKPRDKNECRKRLGLPLSKNIILHVGNETPRKNVSLLIQAFHKLHNLANDVMLVRIGERKKGTYDLIKGLGLENSVLYFNGISDEELAYSYNAADLFVFPSIGEGFGIPPLEAMASGCPVIGGDRTSTPEIVGNGGVLIDPFDRVGFVRWMENIVRNENLRKELSQKGIKQASKFSWEKCAKQTLEVYKKVKESSNFV